MAKVLTPAQVRTSTLTKRVAVIGDIEIYSHRVSSIPGTHIIVWADGSDWDSAPSLIAALSRVQDYLQEKQPTRDEIISKYTETLTGEGDWKAVRDRLTAFYNDMKAADESS